MMAENSSRSSETQFHDTSRQVFQQPQQHQHHQQQGVHQTSQNISQQQGHHGPIVWNNHNPFDLNSYPMTNPPIIDSTFFLPYTNEAGVQRRRRYSISNGQIGQIVNHEAFLADDNSNDDSSDVPFKYVPDQLPGPNVSGNQPVSESQIYGHPLEPYEMEPHPPHAGFVQQQHHRLPPGPKLEDTGDQPQHILHAAERSDIAGSGPPIQNPQAPFSHPQQPPQSLHQGQPEGEKSMENVAGVPPPNHQLIYNNEVIYTADGGPIPGTAAWKKERLLERNRIAASKCRQRKKQAQQQLQNSISKYEKEMKDQRERLEKYEKLLALYNKTLGDFFTNKVNSIDSLRLYVGKPVDEIDFESLNLGPEKGGR